MRDRIVHVTAVCPFCQTSYQVQPALRGQPIRCPNPACRKIFAVPKDLPQSDDPAPRVRSPRGNPPPEKDRRSGSVGDMVPIVPAEPAAPSPKPTDGDWWQTPPPVRKDAGRPTAAPPPAAPPAGEAAWWNEPEARRRRAPDTLPMPPSKPAKEPEPTPPPPEPADAQPEAPEQPRELPPGVWEPPPVRRGAAAEEEAPTPTEEVEDDAAPRVSRRRAWRIILLLVVVVGGILGVGGWLTYQAIHKTEDSLFGDAKREYDQGKYGSAANLFRNLAAKFPDSESADKYRFLEQWSELLSGFADESPADAMAKMEGFLKDHKKDPFIKQYAADAGHQLLLLTQAFADRNTTPSDDKPLAGVERAEQLRQTVQKLGPEALAKADAAKIDDALGKVRQGVAHWREHEEVLSQLKCNNGEAPIVALKRGRSLLEKKDRVSPGYSRDPDVQAAMTRLYDTHFASVIYQSGAAAPAVKSKHADDDAKSILFAPLLPTASPGRAPDNDPIVLALVRGVLYALRQSNGELVWAIRVGIDTTVLPERVPASAASPERVLVLSADTQTMTAHGTDGTVLWEYHIGQPVLGRPVIIQQRAYLSAYDGWIHEIELSEGRLIGRYNLGQPLTRGGTREGQTSRIYFPADDTCIYVLDVAEHRCVNILYDGHPSGSLRSEPLIVPPPDSEGAAGYLILNQTGGLDTMRLRVFELPLRDRHAAAVALDPPPQFAGWTWFDPLQDGEKMVALSDAGVLGLFGIHQVGNRDQALFPLLQPAGLDLSPFLHASSGGAGERGRALVVQMRGDDLWVLARGRLQKVQLRWSNSSGPRAVVGWEAPRELGSPLHAPQRIEDRSGRSTFFLVTQALDRQTCMASAIDEDGRILWQRQLGLVCQGEPLALTPPQGGPPLLLALDQGGGLFSLDPSPAPAGGSPRKMWESIAASLPDNPRLPPIVLPAGDGHSAYEIAAPGSGQALLVRHIEWVGEERRLRVREGEVPLRSAAGDTLAVPAGTPAVVGGHLIVPMADSNLARVPLPLEKQSRFDFGGPSWRSAKAPLHATAHLLALGGDRFLASDGRAGLAVWEWPKDRAWQSLPEGREAPNFELPNRLASPPLLLPAKDGAAPRFAVADSEGAVHLLAVAADGALQPTSRQWDLKGRITGGPFLRVQPDGTRIGCMLEQNQLVWLDPEKADPLWTYKTGGEAIVGQPQTMGDLIVVALQSGRYIGIDAHTGKVEAPGYRLRASAAPAEAPLPFGLGQLFAPLSDGTALLLSPTQLRKTKAAPEKSQ